MGNKNQHRKKVSSTIYCRYKDLWVEHGNLNKPKTEEHKQKLRKPKPDGFGEKVSSWRKGRSTGPRSDRQKAAAGAVWKGKSRKNECLCEYCGKETSQMNYVKWHGINCRKHPECSYHFRLFFSGCHFCKKQMTNKMLLGGKISKVIAIIVSTE